MHTTTSSIKASGGRIAELKVPFKGLAMPVNVYLVEVTKGEPFVLCVCYEDSPIETRLYLDKTVQGWKERYSDDHDLASVIGPMVETLMKQRMYN